MFTERLLRPLAVLASIFAAAEGYTQRDAVHRRTAASSAVELESSVQDGGSSGFDTTKDLLQMNLQAEEASEELSGQPSDSLAEFENAADSREQLGQQHGEKWMLGKFWTPRRRSPTRRRATTTVGPNEPAAFDTERMERLTRVIQEAAKMNVSGSLDVLTAIAEAAMKRASTKEITDMLHKNFWSEVHLAVDAVSAAIDLEDAVKMQDIVDSQLLSELSELAYGDTKEKAEGENVIEFDIKIETPKGAGLLQDAIASGSWVAPLKLWTGPAIKYCYEKGIAASSKRAMDHAIQHITNLVPCLKFQKVKSPANGKCNSGTDKAIYIKSSASGCWSFLGKPQFLDVTELNLEANGCDIMGIAAHEMLHALGVLHEQARPDANKYVTIHWDNILKDKKDQYIVAKNADTRLPYDIQSLMHYPDYMFAVWGKKTMTSKIPGKVMGNRMGLAKSDALQLGKMYGCEATVKAFKLCVDAREPQDRNSCTKGDCICHQDPATPGEIIKVSKTSSCNRCVLKCPDWFPGRPDCGGCAVGTQMKSAKIDNEKYFYCQAEGEQQEDPVDVPDPLHPDPLHPHPDFAIPNYPIPDTADVSGSR